MRNAKVYYRFLDFMRFLCSLSVVLHHNIQQLTFFNYMHHNHVIVDFFVMLGGFVAASADEGKLSCGKKTFLMFFWHRCLRLFPMIFFGLTVGTILLFVGDFYFYINYAKEIIFCLFLNILILPFFYNIDGLPGYVVISNPPLSTIFYQTAITFLWARFFPGCSRKTLILCVAFSAIVLALVAVKLNDINLGWGGPHAPWGYLRTFYSFFVGVLIYRYCNNLPYHKSFPFLCVFLIVFMGIAPFENHLARGLIFFFLPPLTLFLGACCRDRKLAPYDIELGRMTYSIYICHYLVIFAILSLFGKTNNIYWIFLTVPACLVFSYFIRVCYDVPIAAFVKKHLMDYFDKSRDESRSVKKNGKIGSVGGSCDLLKHNDRTDWS